MLLLRERQCRIHIYGNAGHSTRAHTPVPRILCNNAAIFFFVQSHLVDLPRLRDAVEVGQAPCIPILRSGVAPISMAYVGEGIHGQPLEASPTLQSEPGSVVRVPEQRPTFICGLLDSDAIYGPRLVAQVDAQPHRFCRASCELRAWSLPETWQRLRIWIPRYSDAIECVCGCEVVTKTTRHRWATGEKVVAIGLLRRFLGHAKGIR
mmetsp:Transcript_124591/g.398916  ORF Transcript_124591/g.398916 Transcript_124591/m.398916 type:complete len:207 (+) Transcript_124591:6294-6914(+)